VEQPRLSVVFLFDTSDSMGPFVDLVMGGMRSFAAGVEPGKDVAMIMPLGQDPLLHEWHDQAFVLQDAVNRFAFSDGVSSATEEGLIAATELLAERDGRRAILVVSDAETTSLQLAPDLWDALEDARPIIDSVHVSNWLSPRETRDLMQSWASSSGGRYENPTTHGEMNRLFDRMSARLRRPAVYTLSASTSQVNLDPGTLSVGVPEEGAYVDTAGDIGIEIILDTSASMRKKLEGQRRIDVAKRSLRTLINTGLSEGVPVAMRVFGAKGSREARSCGTRLAMPLQPLKRAKALKLVKKLRAGEKTSTPIAAALRAVAGDLADVTGTRTVVLITDGAARCNEDPADAIEELRAKGFDVKLNIVGFALNDEDIKTQMEAWADAGNGSFFDASGGDELAAAVTAAVSAPYRVYGPDDEPIVGGTVGGDPVTLEPGMYRVEVLGDPPVVFDDVHIGGGQVVGLTLPEPVEDG
jgi:Mg-chelatase subunit ChlD